jgi:hypothetical protein
MTTLLLQGRYSGSPTIRLGFVSYLRNRWREHQLLRSMELVPFDVLKDIGFPAAERANDA